MKHDREFQPVRLKEWLTGCMCWETKSGFLLIAAGGLLLGFTDWRLPLTGFSLGWAVLGLGAFIQAAGLARDLLILRSRSSCRLKRK